MTRYNLCLVACKKDTGLVNVLTHIIVSNVTNTTILFYMRIAGGRMSKAPKTEASSKRSEETSSSPTEPRQNEMPITGINKNMFSSYS